MDSPRNPVWREPGGSDAARCESIDHLFRREAGRMIASLTRVFGVHNLALAEDVVQDALCRALEVWKLRGMPENPSAWLMTTAKNRAVDVLRRERRARAFAPSWNGCWNPSGPSHPRSRRRSDRMPSATMSYA